VAATGASLSARGCLGFRTGALELGVFLGAAGFRPFFGAILVDLSVYQSVVMAVVGQTGESESRERYG